MRTFFFDDYQFRLLRNFGFRFYTVGTDRPLDPPPEWLNVQRFQPLLRFPKLCPQARSSAHSSCQLVPVPTRCLMKSLGFLRSKWSRPLPLTRTARCGRRIATSTSTPPAGPGRTASRWPPKRTAPFSACDLSASVANRLARHTPPPHSPRAGPWRWRWRWRTRTPPPSESASHPGIAGIGGRFSRKTASGSSEVGRAKSRDASQGHLLLTRFTASKRKIGEL